MFIGATNLSGNKRRHRIDVQKEISNGDLLLGPGEDFLTMAIAPEHPGHTRAVGHDIGLRKGMQGLDKKKKRKVVDKEVVSKMQVQLDEAMTELAELRTLFAMQKSRNQVPNNVCFSVQNNRSGSTSTLDALDTIKVMIDNIDERYKGIPVPVMTNEVGILEDAVGTVIQWPQIANCFVIY
ncbi:unnamed protein product [Lactuca saligna]|uniref:DUF8039 domain-containing protein n=1 Tax=Lactuca saligna TaxID=75948 RepID=A0AA35VX37_LACSI|nr:unnamed protein product [Lactuca saligna]